MGVAQCEQGGRNDRIRLLLVHGRESGWSVRGRDQVAAGNALLATVSSGIPGLGTCLYRGWVRGFSRRLTGPNTNWPLIVAPG